MINENKGKDKQNGWTFIEDLAVLLILEIISSIISPLYLAKIEKAGADVCEVNRKEVERLYDVDRHIQSINHTEVRFANFLLDEFEGPICPLDGDIMYVDGKVNCSLHGNQIKESSFVRILSCICCVN